MHSSRVRHGATALSRSYGSITASNKVARSYDYRNRLLKVDFPNGSDQDITLTRWPNGPVKTATRGGITRTTNYNRRGLLTFEKISVDGATYEIDTDYNTRGQPNSLTYPDGSSVDYAPDAWGEPTRIGTFATGLAYWPNGAVKGFTYGNGIAHSMMQDERMLPASIVEGSVQDRDYDYDGVGNVTAITDQLAGHADSVSMSYDATNRLVTANAATLWGNATFTYDDTDNLKTAKIGNVTTTFTIDFSTKCTPDGAISAYAPPRSSGAMHAPVTSNPEWNIVTSPSNQYAAPACWKPAATWPGALAIQRDPLAASDQPASSFNCGASIPLLPLSANVGPSNRYEAPHGASASWPANGAPTSAASSASATDQPNSSPAAPSAAPSCWCSVHVVPLRAYTYALPCAAVA